MADPFGDGQTGSGKIEDLQIDQLAGERMPEDDIGRRFQFDPSATVDAGIVALDRFDLGLQHELPLMAAVVTF